MEYPASVIAEPVAALAAMADISASMPQKSRMQMGNTSTLYSMESQANQVDMLKSSGLMVPARVLLRQKGTASLPIS